MTSHPWKPTLGDGHERLSVLVPKPACRACEDRLRCTGNADGRGRHIILLPQPLQEIQTRVRREQDAPEWQQHYAIRAGCEATVSETVHTHGLRHCRYRGTAKTHVQQSSPPPDQHHPAQRMLPARQHTTAPAPSLHPIPATLPNLDWCAVNAPHHIALVRPEPASNADASSNAPRLKRPELPQPTRRS
ncbi:transposase [Streptomyces klenkii]|uniref:transposase n=1 Tax=Streptomyces klenkii TaxID=1420899 RepID=UPI003F4CF9F6